VIPEQHGGPVKNLGRGAAHVPMIAARTDAGYGLVPGAPVMEDPILEDAEQRALCPLAIRGSRR
jgi:hypothetical protein